MSLLCDFVEAMNPGLVLSRKPTILRDRDLAGELKDVWLAVQNKREREKGMNQDVMYKVILLLYTHMAKNHVASHCRAGGSHPHEHELA